MNVFYYLFILLKSYCGGLSIIPQNWKVLLIYDRSTLTCNYSISFPLILILFGFYFIIIFDYWLLFINYFNIYSFIYDRSVFIALIQYKKHSRPIILFYLFLLQVEVILVLQVLIVLALIEDFSRFFATFHGFYLNSFGYIVL